MEHVVFFPAADGSPAFRRVPTLDEAVRLVEHLRNVEGLSTVSVHALTEVPLSFRAYYRVEVPTDAVPAQPLGEPAVEPVARARAGRRRVRARAAGRACPCRRRRARRQQRPRAGDASEPGLLRLSAPPDRHLG